MTQSELMDLIFERPGLYIGFASVIRMEAFINGFSFGNETDAMYSGFTQWLMVKRETRGQYPWSAVTTMVGGSEQSAFDVAREYWEEYKNSFQVDSTISN